MIARRVFLAVALLWLSLAQLASASQARIIRLSEVEGSVRVDRTAGSGMEPAILNMPVTQGMRITTGEDGRAEVEFENGSTVRIAGPGEIFFPNLSLSEHGKKTSAIEVESGVAYFALRVDGSNRFTVVSQGQQFQVPHSSRFRLQVENDRSQLAVFGGKVEYVSSKKIAVHNGHTLTFAASEPDQAKVAKLIAPNPFDAWDQQEQQNESSYEDLSRYGTNSDTYAYGMSDLSAYGGYEYLPNWGWMWQPYGVGVGWNPFLNGAWSFYPAFGWTFIGAYPWAWTPYHSGQWFYIPGRGWFWQQGTTAAWYPTPSISNPPPNFLPPNPPLKPRGPTTLVRSGTPAPVPAQGIPSPSGGRLFIPGHATGLGAAHPGVTGPGPVTHMPSAGANGGTHSGAPSAGHGGIGGAGGRR